MDKKHRHFVVHKPYGAISQFINTLRRKKIVLGDLHEFPEGTMSIGRLDADSEGLLFLTTDGKMSQYVRSRKVEKEYHVQLDGLVTDEAIEQLKSGVDITVKKYVEPYRTKPCKAHILDPPPEFLPRTKKVRDDRHGPTRWVSITLTEGKFRQVRKMTAAVGFPTLRLFRVRIGNVHLAELPAGGVFEVPDFDTTLFCTNETINQWKYVKKVIQQKKPRTIL